MSNGNTLTVFTLTVILALGQVNHQAEVSQLTNPVHPDEDIFWFDVHMDEIMVVKVLEGEEKIHHVGPGDGLAQPTALSEVLQAGAAELELLVEPCCLLPAVVEPHQVAVRGQELMFPHLLQLPHSVARPLVHLPGNLHCIQPIVFSEFDPVHCA